MIKTVSAFEYEQMIELLDNSDHSNDHYALGLNGEAGEVAEIIKKSGHGHGFFANKPIEGERREALGLELGDTLWYLVRLANKHGFPLYEIMGMNVEKLKARRLRAPKEKHEAERTISAS